MTASVVSICSNASLLLGGKAISDLNESNDRARLASNLFEPVRDYVLQCHPWKCATKRAALAPDATTPAFDWAYQFTLPSDFLFPLSIGEEGAEAEYLVESGKLLCDENPVFLRYIWRNTNPALWDGVLVWGMTVAMKSVMAYPVTASTSLEELVDNALVGVLKRARAVDGQMGTPQTLGDSPLLNSRFIGGMGARGWR
jgi:hypothetical protein